MDSPRIVTLSKVLILSLGIVWLAALGGCATTASIRHQSMLLQQTGRLPAATLDPYPGMGLHVSVSCDDRVRFFMISPLVPLPPIIPAMVGSGDQRVRVNLDMSQEAVYELAETPAINRERSYDVATPIEYAAPRIPMSLQLITADGEMKPMLSSSTWGLGRISYVFAANCDDLDGATLVIKPLSPAAQHLGSVKLELIYKYSDEIQIAYMQ